MNGRRFDAIAKALAAGTTRGRALKGTVGGVGVAAVSVQAVGAQDDDALAGNGGVATASANGGTVTVGDVNTGGNTGNTIVVGDVGGDDDDCKDCWGDDGGNGSVIIDGGSVATSTTISISADGGTAVADASGGDFNVAIVSG